MKRPNITFLLDGEAALAYLKDPSNAPHVVLMDISMPKMRGTDVMRAHRPGYPVVAMTSNVEAFAQREYQGLGFVHTLPKPFAAQELSLAVAAALAATHT